MELVLLALAYSVVLYEVHKRVRVPVASLLLVGGLVTGAVSESQQFNDCFALWKQLDYKTVELVFLPGLIFGTAVSLDWWLFKRYFSLIGVLASVGVMATWALTSVLVGSLYDWDLRHCFLLGAVLTTTDYTAVAAELRERHAERRFGVLLQGESLLNQALAFILLQEVLRGYYAGDYAWHFFLLLMGGIVSGLVVSIVMHQILKRVINDAIQETTLLLVSTYALFFATEKLDCSGATSVAVYGLYMSAYGKSTISASVEQEVRLLWQFLRQGLEAQVLFASGVIVGIKVRDQEIEVADVWKMACLVGYTVVVRVAVVFLLYPVMKKLQQSYGWREAIVLGCTGAKGVLSIVFSLVVYDSNLVSTHSAAQVLFQTVCVCTTSTFLSHYAARVAVQLLDLSSYSKPEALTIAKSVYDMFEEVEQETFNLQQLPQYSEVNWTGLGRVITPNVVLSDLVRQSSPLNPRPRNNTEQELLSIVQAAGSLESAADLPLLRRKFILIYRRMYWKECEQGQCFPGSAAQLDSAAGRSLELANSPLAEWNYVQELLHSAMAILLTQCSKGPLRCILASFARNQLQSAFDIASTFVLVQRKACEAFSQEAWTLSQTVVEESNRQQELCETFLRDHFSSLHREVQEQVQGKKAVFALFSAVRRKISAAHKAGRIGDQYLAKLLAAADGKKKSLETG